MVISCFTRLGLMKISKSGLISFTKCVNFIVPDLLISKQGGNIRTHYVSFDIAPLVSHKTALPLCWGYAP